MTPLRLSPLPLLRSTDASGSWSAEVEGFVDEAAVSALVYGPAANFRQVPYRQDLALAADDLDFAGWQLPSPQPPHRSGPLSQTVTPVRRPAEPEIVHPEPAQPNSGSHRWWFAGLAGILSTTFFYLFFLSLPSRHNGDSGVTHIPRPPVAGPSAQIDNGTRSGMPTELTTLTGGQP